MRPVLLLALALGATGCTITCGPGTHEVDGRCVLDITDLESIRELCRDEPYDTAVFEVLFPALEPDCPWNEGDNTAMAEAALTARVEQELILELPEGAVLCDIEFDFASSGDVYQEMLYDDDIFLTFDGVVITANDGNHVEKLPLEEGLPLWDWSAVVGGRISASRAWTYCLGEGSYCELPPTETAGRFALTYDQDTVTSLAWRALGRESITMAFITGGDDDLDKDCRHEDFRFDLVVPWVPVE